VHLACRPLPRNEYTDDVAHFHWPPTVPASTVTVLVPHSHVTKADDGDVKLYELVDLYPARLLFTLLQRGTRQSWKLLRNAQRVLVIHGRVQIILDEPLDGKVSTGWNTICCCARPQANTSTRCRYIGVQGYRFALPWCGCYTGSNSFPPRDHNKPQCVL
jgi:hypothetical protein